MASEATTAIAKDLRQALAGGALTALQAKLYSQRLRRDMGSQGLAGFGVSDIHRNLDEAMMLLECALLERHGAPDGAWRDGVKLAGEILEWLSQPSLRPAGAPLHLLAAAAYQLADFPAMALGVLRRIPDHEPMSAILREFLCANFPETLDLIRIYWRNRRTNEAADHIDADDLTAMTFGHVVMCIGTVCAYLRTGEGETVERALTKLHNLARSLLLSRDPFSYMLARLTAESSRRLVEACIWPQIDRLHLNNAQGHLATPENPVYNSRDAKLRASRADSQESPKW